MERILRCLSGRRAGTVAAELHIVDVGVLGGSWYCVSTTTLRNSASYPSHRGAFEDYTDIACYEPILSNKCRRAGGCTRMKEKNH